MNLVTRGFLATAATCVLAATVSVPMAKAQSASAPAQSVSSAKTEQWIHVRVDNKDEDGETVRVNMPVDLAIKILPTINKNNLHEGKVHIDDAHFSNDVDCRALLDAVRNSKDGEYVTVQSRDEDVRVAKSGGYLLIRVKDSKHHARSKDAKNSKESVKPDSDSDEKVEVKVPIKVVDALFSAGKDELDVLAALRALSANGDTELVSVRDSENTVHIWIDSKNIAD